MAITLVFPAPVANFSARRKSLGLASAIGALQRPKDMRKLMIAPSNFRQPDDCLDGL